MSAPGMVLDLPPETPEQIAARISGAPLPPTAAPIPPALLAGPGAGTIIPPGGASPAALAAGIEARAPIPVAHVSSPGLGGAPAPFPLAPPAAAPPPAMAPPPAPIGAPSRRGGGGGAAPRAPGAPDPLEQGLTAAGQKATEGIQATQDAKAEGAEGLQRAYEDLSVTQRADAVELADRQTQARAMQAELDRQDAANLKKARDYTVPDFWKGNQGGRVASVISIAMGGIASGILGGPNGALQIVNKNIDDYFHRQKEKVDNLYRYAEQTGRMNNQTRMRYAQELTDLQAQHLAVQQSALTRIKAVEAKNTGNVDRAATQGMVATLEQQIIKGKEDLRANQAQILHMTNSDAETARHNRATESIQRQQIAATAAAKPNKGDDDVVYDAKGQAFARAQTPAAAQKFRDQQRALTDLGAAIGELDESYKQGWVLPGGFTDAAAARDGILSRITLAAKTVGELGALSGPDKGLVDQLSGGRLAQLRGSRIGLDNLRRMHENGVNTSLSQIGAQPSPENRARFAAAANSVPAPSGGAPGGAQTSVRMPDGSVATFDASGRRIK